MYKNYIFLEVIICICYIVLRVKYILIFFYIEKKENGEFILYLRIFFFSFEYLFLGL